MLLNDLPNELLLSVADTFDRQSDINALARSSRSLYVLLNPFLYQQNVERHRSSALLWAAEYGQDATLQLILDEGGDVHVKKSHQESFTALHLACANGHLRIAAHLIINGALVEAKTTEGLTPLQLAVRFGHEPVTRWLIENGASLDRCWPIDGKPLLHVASYLGHTSIVELLLDKGADLELRDSISRRTPLHCAVKHSRLEMPLNFFSPDLRTRVQDKYN